MKISEMAFLEPREQSSCSETQRGWTYHELPLNYAYN